MKMLELKQNSSWRLIWSSWQWLKLFQRPPKLLLFQALLFLHVLSPLVGTVNSQNSEQNDDFIPFTTSTESALLQRVTISSSYSNTNYKAGLSSHLTIHSHNNNNNNNISNLNPNDGVRRRLLLSAKDLPHSSSSRSSNNRKNRTNNHQKQRNLRNNAHKNNQNKLTRGSVGSGNSIRKTNVSTTTTTTTKKPTMHPLRVLQTEISTPARISVIRTSTPVVPTNITTKVSSFQTNLDNHRLNSGEIVKPATSEQYLTDDIKSQLALINRGVRAEALVGQYDKSNNNDGRSNVVQNKHKPSMASAVVTPEGRSSLDSTEVVKPTNAKQRSDNGKSISAPDQGKNMKSAPFSNYFNTYTDNIAEEDHQYEVTELVNQFTGEYDSHRNDDQPEEEGRREEEELRQSSSSQQYHHHHDGQQQQQEVIPYEMQPSQRPNHSHYHRRPNLKPKKNRPKLNSYYDQNYYAASSVQAEPASDNNNHEQHHSEHYGYKKQKEYHYYENNNNYHGNDDTSDGSHYANPPQSHPQPHHGSPYPVVHAPTTGPQQYYTQQQPQQLHHQQTISHMGSGHHQEYPTTAIQPQIIPTVSSTSSSSSGSRHPAPKPYTGEHDNQSTDSIMDRFEVFYTEYKLLAWIGLFGLISLGFIILIVVLYLRNPPTEVVTARSMLTQYLNDPSLLKFLSNILDDQAHVSKKIRRRKKIN